MMRKTPSIRIVLLLLATVIAIGSFRLNRVAADETNHEGTILAVSPGSIVIVNREGTIRRTFPIAEFVKVTRGGQMVGLNSLARGDLVQLTTELRLRTEYVVAVESIPRE